MSLSPSQRLLSTILLGALLVLPTAGQGAVLVVDDDGGPGVDYTDVQAAILAAADGDTLLIKDGHYGPAVIDGKGLTLQAEVGADAVVSSSSLIEVALEIKSTGPGQEVLLEGLELNASSAAMLWIHDTNAPVWIEDCVLEGDPYGTLNPQPPYAGCAIERASDVILTRTVIGGLRSCVLGVFCGANTVPGSPGLVVLDSDVHAFDCQVIGGFGGIGTNGFSFYSTPAGDGVRVESGFGLLSGSTIIGGAVGTVIDQVCPPIVPGPHGVAYGASGDPTTIVVVDTASTGGSGSRGGFSCQYGPDGYPYHQEGPGTLDFRSGTSPKLDSTPLVREGGTLSLGLKGLPGASAWLVAGSKPFGFYSPVISGTLAIAPPIGVLSLGPFDGNGERNLSLPVSNLAPGDQSAVLYGQVLMLDPGAGFVLGSPTAVVIVDSIF